MGGPSIHGQRNKKHKSGRQAGASARDKHRSKKEGHGLGLNGRDAAALGAKRKADRLAGVKAVREKKRSDFLDKRRRQTAPHVVGVLPLSSDVDAQALWDGIIQATAQGVERPSGKDETDMDADLSGTNFPMAMRTVAIQGRKSRVTLLPPPPDRQDPLALVELLKAVDVLVLGMPGDKTKEPLDADGRLALDLLAALGVTSIVGLVQGAADTSMKARSAARKASETALGSHFSGDHRMLNFDTAEDGKQLCRFLDEHSPTIPVWRQQRPSLLIESAEPCEVTGAPGLVLTGFIRCAGLSANQNLHIPGAGDFQIERIEALPDVFIGGVREGHGDIVMGGDAQPWAVATADPEARDSLQRENVFDPLAGEQTWPTDEELMEAEASSSKQQRRRRLPKGTSAYQAAWIPEVVYEDEDEGDDDDDDDNMDGDAEDQGDSGDEEEEEFEDEVEESDGMTIMDEEETEAQKQAMMASMKRQRAEADDEFPDEVDTPLDVTARTRFDKYRGLKSFRTSPWDPKESLPQDYSRVYAFENFTRAHKRAVATQQQAGGLSDPDGISASSFVRVFVSGVDGAVGTQVSQRVKETTVGGRPPLVAVGLMQHECKLSVMHLLLKKAKGYDEPIASKDELVISAGVRSFKTRLIFSQHGRADKHKMERFLRPGEFMVASCYAPIAYPQLPVLVFKAADPEAPFGPGRRTRLAATGSLHSCNPDRVIVKKIVLTGFPVRVHKKKAVIKYMFHNPDDVKWFKPLELWTKYGRRGRIREPVGDHGTMKCIFDGPLQQRDSVCISLYKRAFPKWPQSMTFA